MPSTKILVVEDEFLIGEDIVNHLTDMGYDVTGPIDNYARACQMLADREFDMALIDIKLQGEKDGIDIAAYIRANLDMPVIFLSSLEHHSILARAKSVKPSAYLLKPFNAKAVGIAIEIALTNHAIYDNSNHQIEGNISKDVLPVNNYVFLRKDHYFQRIKVKDIQWLKAGGNYTEIYTQTDLHVQTIQLSKVEVRLPKTIFKRVHRSYIANLEAVTGFSGNTLFINDHKIPVSTAYREEVFNLLNSI